MGVDAERGELGGAGLVSLSVGRFAYLHPYVWGTNTRQLGISTGGDSAKQSTSQAAYLRLHDWSPTARNHLIHQ